MTHGGYDAAAAPFPLPIGGHAPIGLQPHVQLHLAGHCSSAIATSSEAHVSSSLHHTKLYMQKPTPRLNYSPCLTTRHAYPLQHKRPHPLPLLFLCTPHPPQ